MGRAFYETDSEARWWAGITGRLVAAILVVLLIGGGVTALLTGVASFTGRGGAYRQQQSSTNRIAQNSAFFELKAKYDTYTSSIADYKQAAATGDTAAVIQLRGMKTLCREVVADYAAASGAYISKDFKDAGLPVALDPFACQ